MDSVFREIKIVKIKIAFHEGEVVWKCCEARRMPELGEPQLQLVPIEFIQHSQTHLDDPIELKTKLVCISHDVAF
jgi:hypothetical protein